MPDTGPFGPLQGKVGLVTGASRGIGAAAARALAEAGAAVVLAARNERALAERVGEIEEKGGRALAVPTDVADEQSTQRTVERAVTEFGRLDAAFNNAAAAHRPPTPLAEMPVEEIDTEMGVTLRGVFLSMKYEIPAMLASGGGAIVNMTSTAGLDGVAGLASYVSSKHAVIGLTKTAALDYAGQGVRVNAVAPGPILTEQLAAAGEQAQRQVGMAMPMRRIGTPDEVAQAVVALLGRLVLHHRRHPAHRRREARRHPAVQPVRSAPAAERLAMRRAMPRPGPRRRPLAGPRPGPARRGARAANAVASDRRRSFRARTADGVDASA